MKYVFRYLRMGRTCWLSDEQAANLDEAQKLASHALAMDNGYIDCIVIETEDEVELVKVWG